MGKITDKQKQLITQLLIKQKRQKEIKGINVLNKQEADEYIKELLGNTRRYGSPNNNQTKE